MSNLTYLTQLIQLGAENRFYSTETRHSTRLLIFVMWLENVPSQNSFFIFSWSQHNLIGNICDNSPKYHEYLRRLHYFLKQIPNWKTVYESITKRFQQVQHGFNQTKTYKICKGFNHETYDLINSSGSSS